MIRVEIHCLISWVLSVDTSGIVDAAVSRVQLDLDSDSKAQMLKIIERLSLSESEYLVYDRLVDEFGFTIVRQMISKNLLFYRATQSISGDSDADPWEPIVTASCVPVLRAMQRIIRRRKSFASDELSKPTASSEESKPYVGP